MKFKFPTKKYIRHTWFTTDGVATNVAPEPEFAGASVSEAAGAYVAGTIANAFEENESDKEPSKSTSALFEVVGAADQREDKT